jgi:3-oxosteroid 1-dehydrogenase
VGAMNGDSLPSETDVVVVGGGPGGLAAANAAARNGAEVVLVEAGETTGGTALKAYGTVLAYNNRFHREAGIEDDRDTALRMMAKTSYPDRYDPNAENLGLDRRDLELIEVFFDKSSEALEALEDEGTIVLGPQNAISGDPRGWPSYFSDLPEETVVYGRGLTARNADGFEGHGPELTHQLLDGAVRKGARVFLRRRATEILRDGDEVIGVRVDGPAGTEQILARKGVIFATGGFSHNRELFERHVPGFVPGSAAGTHSKGDFIEMTDDLDVDLHHLDKVWLSELPVEFALQAQEAQSLLHFTYGDSLIYVSPGGKRVVNEKLPYDRRARAHFAQDADGSEPNRVLFMIYDSAVANDPSGMSPIRWPIPPAGQSSPWVIQADTLADLEEELRARLERIAESTGGLTLDPDFTANLEATVAEFNKVAEEGRDPVFHRGEIPIEIDTTGAVRPGNHPNPTMYPLAPQGPYYCVMLAAAALDTKGGPRTDAEGRILTSAGTPIRRLYGVGNCVASPSGDGYWTGGATIGIAITFGHLAGQAVAAEQAREENPLRSSPKGIRHRLRS